MNVAEIALWLRVLGYTGAALLFAFVVPIYHRSFRLTWRALALYWLAALGTVVLRLLGRVTLSIAYNDWVLTGALALVLGVSFYNLFVVIRWNGGPNKHG